MGGKEENYIRLTELPTYKEGIIYGFTAGHGLERRLMSMGIIRGKKVKKLSRFFWHGPIVITIGNMWLALGYGVANKVIVKYKDNKNDKERTQ